MRTFISAVFALLFPGAACAALLGGGEWFINSDPGHGNGTPIATSETAAASLSLEIPANTIHALPPGVRLLGVRVREKNGEWGHVLWRTFLKDKAPESVEAAEAEWFVDADPGAGNGVSIAVSVGKGAATVPTADLSEGVHLLGTRARDSAGRWGAAVWRPFIVEGPLLAAVEYEIVREGAVVGGKVVANEVRGAEISMAIQHGKDGLELESNHVLRVIPIAADGRRGEPFETNFDYLRYADAWRAWHFSMEERQNPQISGSPADPDLDGLENFKEMTFALNPRDASDPPLATVSFAAVQGGHELSFRVPPGGIVGSDGIYRTSDLEYRVRESVDLAIWKDVPAGDLSSWSLVELPGSQHAARLQVQVSSNYAPVRFFVIQAER